MLYQIVIEKLFQRFDYTINLVKPDGITIITGPNGYGKSTILKIIKTLSDADLFFFFKLDFSKIVIQFGSNTKFVIKKGIRGFHLNDEFFSDNLLLYKKGEAITKWREVISTKREYYVYSQNKVNEILCNNKSELSRKELDDLISMHTRFDDIAKKIKEYLGKVKFIQEQRLFKENIRVLTGNTSSSDKNMINVVSEFPDRFKQMFSDIAAQYSAIANKLDSSYPNRLFNTDVGITLEEYECKVEEMKHKFAKLSNYSISDIQTIASKRFRDVYALALRLYFEDFDTKYAVYDEFIQKLDIYTRIVNERLKYKKIIISGKDGIAVVDDNNRHISLADLSSGEKQEIVLFYDLIFDTSDTKLLLIDEPEISLHIAWQKKFMDDLIQIAKLNKFRVVVATHSPQILNGHWENQIDLGELYGD